MQTQRSTYVDIRATYVVQTYPPLVRNFYLYAEQQPLRRGKSNQYWSPIEAVLVSMSNQYYSTSRPVLVNLMDVLVGITLRTDLYCKHLQRGYFPRVRAMHAHDIL